MSHTLEFAERLAYDAGRASITVEVWLSLGDLRIPATAKLDTGASHCIFRRELGEALGIDVAAGDRVEIGTVTGSFVAYGHEVTLEAAGIALDTLVYFAGQYDLPRNVLGRRGWMDRLRLAVVDYDGLLYVSRYDDHV